MKIQLVITEGPSLTAAEIQAFADKAGEKGISPDARLAQLIKAEVGHTAAKGKKRTTAKA